jgi:hypothetical protein
VVYPRPKTFLQSLIERRGPDNSDKEAVGQTLAQILQVVQPVARQLDAAGIKANDNDQDDVLRMNPVATSEANVGTAALGCRSAARLGFRSCISGTSGAWRDFASPDSRGRLSLRRITYKPSFFTSSL